MCEQERSHTLEEILPFLQAMVWSSANANQALVQCLLQRGELTTGQAEAIHAAAVKPFDLPQFSGSDLVQEALEQMNSIYGEIIRVSGKKKG